MSNNEYVIDLKDKSIRNPELERLQAQGDVVTGMVERVLPSFDRPRGQYIDLGCGAGDWVLRMAKEYPQADRIIGIDIFSEAVQYANAEARTQQKEVEFYTGNIMKPQPYPENTFDLVNARFLAGVIPADEEHWPAFVRECYRICKPGGWLQLTEPELSSVRGAPAMHRMTEAEMRVLHRLGKTFAETEMAVSPMLKKFVQGAGFTDVKYHAYAIDFSAGTPAHHAMAKDGLMVATLLKPLLIRELGSEEEFERTYTQMEEELNDPNFRALWLLVRITGRKPA